jgi:hypothetical protein
MPLRFRDLPEARGRPLGRAQIAAGCAAAFRRERSPLLGSIPAPSALPSHAGGRRCSLATLPRSGAGESCGVGRAGGLSGLPLRSLLASRLRRPVFAGRCE